MLETIRTMDIGAVAGETGKAECSVLRSGV